MTQLMLCFIVENSSDVSYYAMRSDRIGNLHEEEKLAVA